MAVECWIKLHTDILKDVKIKRLKRRVKEAFECWVGLLLVCKEGSFSNCVCINENMPYETDELADMIGVEQSSFKKFLSEAESLGMLEISDGFIYISNWDKRQYADGGRTKRHREKSEEPETPAKQNGNATETKVKQNRNESETLLTQNRNASETTDKTRPDKTRQEETRQDQTREEKRFGNAVETKTNVTGFSTLGSVVGSFPNRLSSVSGSVGSTPVEPDRQRSAFNKLQELGVNRVTASELILKFTPDEILQQIEWLPQRKAANPAAILVQSIRENWKAPNGFVKPEKSAKERAVECASKNPECDYGEGSKCQWCPNKLHKEKLLTGS